MLSRDVWHLRQLLCRFATGSLEHSGEKVGVTHLSLVVKIYEIIRHMIISYKFKDMYMRNVGIVNLWWTSSLEPGRSRLITHACPSLHSTQSECWISILLLRTFDSGHHWEPRVRLPFSQGENCMALLLLRTLDTGFHWGYSPAEQSLIVSAGCPYCASLPLTWVTTWRPRWPLTQCESWMSLLLLGTCDSGHHLEAQTTLPSWWALNVLSPPPYHWQRSALWIPTDPSFVSFLLQRTFDCGHHWMFPAYPALISLLLLLTFDSGHHWESQLIPF